MKGDVEGIDNQLKRSEQVCAAFPPDGVVDSDILGSHDDGQDHHGSDLLPGGADRGGSRPLRHLRQEEQSHGWVMQIKV